MEIKLEKNSNLITSLTLWEAIRFQYRHHASLFRQRDNEGDALITYFYGGMEKDIFKVNLEDIYEQAYNQACEGGGPLPLDVSLNIKGNNIVGAWETCTGNTSFTLFANHDVIRIKVMRDTSASQKELPALVRYASLFWRHDTDLSAIIADKCGLPSWGGDKIVKGEGIERFLTALGAQAFLEFALEYHKEFEIDMETMSTDLEDLYTALHSFNINVEAVQKDCKEVLELLDFNQPVYYQAGWLAERMLRNKI